MFDALYAGFAGLIANISNFMYSYLLIILLAAAGVYFTCRSKFVQRGCWENPSGWSARSRTTSTPFPPSRR